VNTVKLPEYSSSVVPTEKVKRSPPETPAAKSWRDAEIGGLAEAAIVYSCVSLTASHFPHGHIPLHSINNP
jgi:hypothetical protein